MRVAKMDWFSSMKFNEILTIGISLLALIVSISSVLYSRSVKRLELSLKRKDDILKWYSSVIDVLFKIKEGIHLNNSDIRMDISKLSSLIQVGIFYYPNVNTGDGFGDHKQSAFRGYRNIVLEFLVIYHDIARDYSGIKDVYGHLVVLERFFTSYVFEDVDVYMCNKQLALKSGKKTISSEFLETFLNADSNSGQLYKILDNHIRYE